MAAIDRDDRAEGGRLIAVVEDSEHDRLFIRRALAGQPGLRLLFLEDGGQLLDLLYGRGAFEGAPLMPALVLLDLRLPGISGPMALRDLRSYPRLQQMPVVVMTGAPLDVNGAELSFLRVADVLHKPADIETWSAMLTGAIDRWAAPQ